MIAADKSTLEIGARAEAAFTVQPRDTAAALALCEEDAFPEVFATSRMIALMELAAARAMRPLLGAGQLSVGVMVDVRHGAATPVDCRVHARATFLGQEGKLFRFRVEAFDEAGTIGSGEHLRSIVDIGRLLDGAARRIAGAG
jgi:fluoroacetyl-CoA thioesterase